MNVYYVMVTAGVFGAIAWMAWKVREAAVSYFGNRSQEQELEYQEDLRYWEECFRVGKSPTIEVKNESRRCQEEKMD
jgi:hypothetical protein